MPVGSISSVTEQSRTKKNAVLQVARCGTNGKLANKLLRFSYNGTYHSLHPICGFAAREKKGYTMQLLQVRFVRISVGHTNFYSLDSDILLMIIKVIKFFGDP